MPSLAFQISVPTQPLSELDGDAPRIGELHAREAVVPGLAVRLLELDAAGLELLGERFEIPLPRSDFDDSIDL